MTTYTPFPPADQNPWPNLFTKNQYRRLISNGEKAQEVWDFQPKPVVKLFTPDGSATWLLSMIESTNPDIAFGLCDLGMGEPECGSVSLTELSTLR